MTDTEDETLQDNSNEAAATAGARLRAARERKGLTLEQVASETRISRRHLESLETADLEGLPGRTYVLGFARTYAKTVGLDQEEIVGLMREELDEAAVNERYEQQRRGGGSFEPGDPSRAPGGRLLYFSLFAVVILLIGIFFAARALFAPAAEIPSLVEQEQQEQAEAEAARQAAQQQQPQQAVAEEPDGPVVFTAEGETWVRFYDGEGRVLQEGTMREGDTFTIPADAPNPQIITGRPDRLAITIGGRPVRKLSTAVETISDVPISADALLSREGGVATIGFGLGTPAAPATQPAQSSEPATQPASTPAPQPSRTVAPSPTSTPTPARTTPAATATPTPTATPEPSPAATAPPRAEPAEPGEGGVSPEVE
ncbi:helix-turn-helix domain-containing protein [Aurantiacibacter odishensis]|uniref:helix-turn-helix domain-containing protein n=1 Tax=Aurantiacibacter odishensis TaxID=1155476 RepID=UPI00196B560C|nr:helix-turn-helix domain-containing protein [Aurantiacibacter odishensis]